MDVDLSMLFFQMLIPPNQTRSPSSPMFPSCTMCSPSPLPATLCSMPRPRPSLNSLKSLPPLSITGSGSTQPLCRYVCRLYTNQYLFQNKQTLSGQILSCRSNSISINDKILKCNLICTYLLFTFISYYLDSFALALYKQFYTFGGYFIISDRFSGSN